MDNNNGKTKIRNTEDDLIDVPKYDSWKRDDINNSRGTMPVKAEVTTTFIKTSSQGSDWNSAKTW